MQSRAPYKPWFLFTSDQELKLLHEEVSYEGLATTGNFEIPPSGVTNRRSASELRSHIKSSCLSNQLLGLDTQGRTFWLNSLNP